MHDNLFLNGRLVSREAAQLSPFDHGFTVGDGVFESLITYGAVPFALCRHVERLHRSAEAMALNAPGLDQLRDAVHSVIAANRCDHARLRITLTRGEAPLGSEVGAACTPTFMIASAELPKRPAQAVVHVVKWTRNEHGALNQIKSTSYAENVIALAAAHAHGAQEAIFCNTQGHLCEGSGSNLFLVRKGTLHTPSLASGCLAGVTRAIVMELAASIGLKMDESPIPLEHFWTADESFLTSTFREIQAITRIDDHTLAAGPITSHLQQAFRKKIEAGDLENA